MHILYIGYYTSDELLYEMQRRGVNNMSVARQKYETNLLTGLIERLGEKELHLLSYVPVGNGFQAPEFSELCGRQITHIPIDRNSFASMRNARKMFVRYLNSLGEDVLKDLHVLMYEVNPIFLSPLLQRKKKYNFRLISICAELSILRRSRKLKYRLRNLWFSHYEKKFDAYVLFAQPMAEVLDCQNKPHIVNEGIAPELFGTPRVKEKNVVMYAGGFGADNNLPLLIEACNSLDAVEELWICGTGKDKPLVEEAAQKSKKIRYFGSVTNDRVRELEQEAKLLVNLRTPDALITKYSFPSKILEYMASGTPILSTRLSGIPKEYFDYLIPVENLELQNVMSNIQNALDMSDEAFLSKAVGAQRFIEKNKNREIQAERILSFVRSL